MQNDNKTTVAFIVGLLIGALTHWIFYTPAPSDVQPITEQPGYSFIHIECKTKTMDLIILNGSTKNWVECDK